MEPNNAELYAMRASVYKQSGLFQEAKNDINTAKKLDPKCPTADYVQVYKALEIRKLE